MYENGYIKLHRSILKWGWYRKPLTKTVFIHLLLKANLEDSEYEGHTIKRGSLVTGRRALSFDTALSEQQIKTALTHLKSTNDITIKSTNKFSVISITNFDSYQSRELSSKQQANNNQPQNKNKRIQEINIHSPAEAKNSDFVKQVVEVMNEVLRTSYKPSSRKTAELINARYNEGFTEIEDYRAVFSYKKSEWSGTDFAKFLRPATLLGTKFESYLQTANRAAKLDEELHALFRV